MSDGKSDDKKEFSYPVSPEEKEKIIPGDKRYGYHLYPERKEKYKPTISEMFLRWQGEENINKVKCEQTVYKCVRESYGVRLMMSALKASGCPIDIRRHISCEECDSSVTGGYDPILNQIVVCQNLKRKKSMVRGVLIHEMIHMFDYCNHKLDFTNFEHVACTEIRAANLTHCSFVSAMIQGNASFLSIKQQHQECVKSRALASMLAVRNMDRKDAMDIINRVFPKCYADLEPIGFRMRLGTKDEEKAYNDRECVKDKAVTSLIATREIQARHAVAVVDKVFPMCYADLEPLGRIPRRSSNDYEKSFREGYYYGYV